MSSLKTVANNSCVNSFIESISPAQKQQDAKKLVTLFSQTTGFAPTMWGDSIIGFGRYRYHNSKGEHEWLLTGFSPRKQNLTIYIMQGFDNFSEQLAQLGKVKHAKSCLYINKLEDINTAILTGLISAAVADMKTRYECCA